MSDPSMLERTPFRVLMVAGADRRELTGGHPMTALPGGVEGASCAGCSG
jgi:hypothetical protein